MMRAPALFSRLEPYPECRGLMRIEAGIKHLRLGRDQDVDRWKLKVFSIVDY